MALFALVAVTFVGLLTFWLHRRLVVAPGWQTPWRYAVTAVLVALTALAVVAIAGGLRWGTADDTRPVAWLGLTWLVVALYLVLGLAAAQLVALITWLVTAREQRGTVLRRFNRATALLVTTAALGTAAYGVVAAADPNDHQDDALVGDPPAGLRRHERRPRHRPPRRCRPRRRLHPEGGGRRQRGQTRHRRPQW